MTRNQPTWDPTPQVLCPPLAQCHVTTRPRETGATHAVYLPRTDATGDWLHDGARLVVAGIESRTYTLRAAGDGWLLCHRTRRWPATTEQVRRRCRPVPAEDE